MIEVALYRPEIPPNTGNIARLCVGVGAPLHIVDKPGFSMDDRHVRRAGLDYWDQLDLRLHADWETFRSHATAVDRPVVAVTKFGTVHHWDHTFKGNEILLMGNETSGLPDYVRQWVADSSNGRLVRIPMLPHFRSLNLSNSAAIVLYEALRQSHSVVFPIPG